MENEAYSYDAVGNRTSASNADGSITHNANNELTVYGDVEYVYDANGNMTEVLLDGQMMFKYVYNAGNRLVKVEGGNNNAIAEYYYDPFGRRLWKEVGGARTYFFYSDEGLVAEHETSGNEIRSYGYTPDSTWTTDPLWLKQHGEYYFYQNDHLGTPQKLVAQNGAVMWSARYSAFGQATVDVSGITNNLRFPGQYDDAETGLHDNFQRYYEPETGRYVSVDPIGFMSEEVNFYGYAENNPITAFDPYGLDVYVAQRRLDVFLNFDINDWQNRFRHPFKSSLLMGTLNFLHPSIWIGSYKEMLAILDWYAQRTRHCSVFILTECDKERLQWFSEDDELTIHNIRYLGLLDDIRGEYSGDFNSEGINIPAADFKKLPFPIEKYRRDAEIVKVFDNHDYDELIKDSILNHYVLPIQYKISDENRYNCCDWTNDVINTYALGKFTSPNPAPFGPRPGAPLTVTIYNNLFTPDFLLAEEFLQQVFDSPPANDATFIGLDLMCDFACRERHRRWMNNRGFGVY